MFCGVLAPAIGFLNVYPFRFSFVADHFQHHASLALFALFAAGLTLAGRKVAARFRRAANDEAAPAQPAADWTLALPAYAASAVLLATLATISFRQTLTYFDVHTLYRDIIDKNPYSWTAMSNLGRN